MSDELSKAVPFPIPMSEVTESHSQGIFRDGLASDPVADALLDVAEAAALVPTIEDGRGERRDSALQQEHERHRVIARQRAAVVVEAARQTVFGDTTMWGFDELCPDYHRIGYYPPQDDEEERFELTPNEQQAKDAYYEALAWEKERFEAADRVMASKLIPVVAGYRDLGVARGFDRLAEKFMGGKPEHRDVEMHHEVLEKGKRVVRRVAWPIEALSEGGIFTRDAEDVELSDALYDQVSWSGPEHHIPQHPEWGRIMGEKWRSWIRRLLRDDERHDRMAIRNLVEAYMHASRELYEIAGLMSSGIFNGMPPGQRQNIELSVPVAFGKPHAYGYGSGPCYIGITQSEYDAARDVSERLDIPVDPISEALDVVAGDYLDQAIEHVSLLASRDTRPWMMREIPSTTVVRQLMQTILAASDARGCDDDKALAKLATIRDLLIKVCEDDEVWRLLSRVT